MSPAPCRAACLANLRGQGDRFYNLLRRLRLGSAVSCAAAPDSLAESLGSMSSSSPWSPRCSIPATSSWPPATRLLASFASSVGKLAPISTRKASAHRPHAPHSGSQRPLPLQHLTIGRIRDGLDLLVLTAGAHPSPYFYLLQSCCTL
ncbi:hypothetical protein ZWY2020_014931 [Hordeum vulgare]|nr:hypothetical protein ZWY2020_014931 [Hordeum vulgare]